MCLSIDVQKILKNNNLLELESLKHLTREDLKNLNLNNAQINQVIIYLQLYGFDIKKTKKVI